MYIGIAAWIWWLKNFTNKECTYKHNTLVCLCVFYLYYAQQVHDYSDQLVIISKIIIPTNMQFVHNILSQACSHLPEHTTPTSS